ncbi:MAG: glycosyltransferase family 39 protein [Candidatus Shapirobacteria bacterium]
MNKSFLIKNWLLIVILLIAAFCRLYRISDYMEFLGDQGRDVVIVRDFLKNGNLFFIGPQTSIGNMYLGPFYYYLIAPALLLANFNPVGPAIFVALLSVATAYLIFHVSKKWFNPTAAYIATFLYAISPTAIKFANFSWNPNIMPFFALLFIYLMTEKRYLWASVAFAMCLNSHYLALILLPLAGIIWLKDYSKASIKPTILAIIIFCISLIPQALFDLKHEGQNIGALSTFFIKRETTVNLKVYKSLPVIPELFNQINTSLLAGKNQYFGIVVSIILLIGIIYLLVKHKNQKLVYCLWWYLFGLIGLGLYKQHIYDHYFGFLFPVLFILIGYLLSKLPKLLTIPLFIFLTFFSLLQNPFRWQAPHQLQTTKSVIQKINSQSNGQPFNFSLLAKQNYDPGYLYFIYENKLPYFHLNQKITDQLFVVCEPHKDINCDPINNPEWGIAAFGWAKIDSESDIDGIRIYKLVHNPSGQK